MLPEKDERTAVDPQFVETRFDAAGGENGRNNTWSPLVRLLNELQQGWQAGASPRVEPLFHRHPEIFDHPDAGLRLIYEEICLRRAHGEDVSVGELYNRFPQWHNQLQTLIKKSEADTIVVGSSEDDFFDAFDLLHELGRGSGGRVYLARQKRLGNRLVVLKVIRSDDMEHLSLARLQHTNIVPLYGVFDDPRGRRRALCMPYFGSTTLFHVFAGLDHIPIARRRGADIVEVIEHRERELPESGLHADLAHHALGNIPYVEAVCRIGAALADALGDAHRRGLLHLDIKPSNVLISTDGLPMLLDFHLARAPLVKGEPPPHFFGGSPPFMAPEQQSACEDVTRMRPIRAPVDVRSEIYSLGMLLVVGLAGEAPEPGVAPEKHLRAKNPLVSVGLADILAKCLEKDPADRYQVSTHLAEDLRRHVQNTLLAHVPNRSLQERWSKWRRRAPMALPIIVISVVAALAVTLGLLSLQQQMANQHDTADTDYRQGRAHLDNKNYAEAIKAFERAQDVLPSFFVDVALQQSIQRDLSIARRSAHLDDLRKAVDELRSVALGDPAWFAPEKQQSRLLSLEVHAANLWKMRGDLFAASSISNDNRFEETLRQDLTELAIETAHARTRLADIMKLVDKERTPEELASDQRKLEDEKSRFRAEAAAILDEAREICRTPRVLEWNQLGPAAALPAPESLTDTTAWEFYLLGRAYMRLDRMKEAFESLKLSVALDPAGYWNNLALAVCALRLNDPAVAVSAFNVCVGRQPLGDIAFIGRGQAYAALDRLPEALRDFDHVLKMRGHVPQVYLERGKVHLLMKNRDLAVQDFDMARQLGANPALIDALLNGKKN